MELLPEAVEAGWSRVAGVALHVVGTRERGHRFGGVDEEVYGQQGREYDPDEQRSDHSLSFSLMT